MSFIPYILSILGLLSMITSLLLKGEKMKLTLFFVFCGNFLVATSYLLDGKGINGAATCYLGGIQTIINYFYAVKEKALPKWLLIIYAITFTGVNIWVAGGVTGLGILIIVASLTFIMCIGQSNGAKYRFWTIINMVLWCVYDIASTSYPSLITHVSLLLFSLVGMFIHDRKQTIHHNSSVTKGEQL